MYSVILVAQDLSPLYLRFVEVSEGDLIKVAHYIRDSPDKVAEILSLVEDSDEECVDEDSEICMDIGEAVDILKKMDLPNCNLGGYSLYGVTEGGTICSA